MYNGKWLEGIKIVNLESEIKIIINKRQFRMICEILIIYCVLLTFAKSLQITDA